MTSLAAIADLLLSSGFLAFARHIGVLRAVEARQVPIDALVGALWAAGLDSHAIEALATGLPPWRLLRLSPRPWQGGLSTSAFLGFVRPHLPARFGDLSRPFAVGTVDAQRRDVQVTDGPLAGQRLPTKSNVQRASTCRSTWRA